MEYKISLNILGKESVDVNLDGSTQVSDIISFIMERFQQLLGNDSSRIILTSKKFNKRLFPLLSIAQILQDQLVDTFDVEINQQSFITNPQPQYPSSYPPPLISNSNNQPQFQNNSQQSGFGGNQQNQFVNQSQNISQQNQFNQPQNQQSHNNQGQNQQIIQGGDIKLNLQYDSQICDCELSLETSLEDLIQFALEQFNIQGSVYMQYENQNLSNLPGSTKLHNIQIKNGSTIQFFQQQQQQLVQQTQQALPESLPNPPLKQQQLDQGEMVKIQFSIEDGVISRSCVVNCGSNQQLKELKLPVLSFIGINDQDIADVDFYVGTQAMVGQNKLKKTLRQLSLNKDYVTLTAKVRWIGG